MEFRPLSRLAAVALVVPALAGIGVAGEYVRPAGVIELFTSQGCNSCPPADELFAELARRDDMVALAYHVDYWNYLGWRDTLSTPENTSRQYDYMRAFGSRSVYTPQAVINGRTHVNGARRDEVTGAIKTMGDQGNGMRVGIKVSRSGNSVMIDADAGENPVGEAHVVLVYFDAPQPIEIVKGENTGKTVTYYNPVTDIQTAGMWHGQKQRYELPMSEISKKGGCAVLLQSVGKEGLPGPILGAAVVRTPETPPAQSAGR